MKVFMFKSIYPVFISLIFLCVFTYNLSADLPKYKMIDMGLSFTDWSDVIAINDKGQVLGSFQEGISRYLFLWDETNGLKIIDYPPGVIWWNFKLNNNGQIAGVLGYDSSCFGSIVYWDASSGFWELESSTENIRLAAINDNGKILGTLNTNGHSKIILWDHGTRIDLTKLFHEQIPGKWTSLQAVSLNNHGHVIFNAYKQAENPNDQNTGSRAFIWKEGMFSMILSKICFETSMNCECLDNNGNMIVSCYPKNGGVNELFFVNEKEQVFIPCQRCDKIRNNQPTSAECLPGKMKTDKNGNSYFPRGVEIKKLLQEELPYYNVKNSAEFTDQNSCGYVIGTAETLYSQRHAFLAFPYE